MPKVLLERTGGPKSARGASQTPRGGGASALQRLADTSPVVTRLRGLGGPAAPVQRLVRADGIEKMDASRAARGQSVRDTGGDLAGEPVLAQESAVHGAHAAPVQRRADGVFQLASMILQLMPKPVAQNDKLKNIVNALFKGAPARGKKIGDGSAMAAASQEAKGGQKVGGRDHIKKLDSILNGLNNLKRKHYSRSPVTLSPADLATVNTLITACTDAKAGNYAG